MIRFDCRLRRPGFQLDAAFEADAGITALFGPSGSGKTTAIGLLAGLDRPDHGRISVDDSVLVDTDQEIFVRPHRRRIGLVFQDALLLPHLSVLSNLTYGQRYTPKPERRITLEPVVDMLGIGHLLSRMPDTLSGGERQRVAIGRALLTSPRVLLMDEPLASLDQERKLEILPFIEKLRDEFAIPTIYVSHSVEEVVRLASKVVKLSEGKVVAVGSPAEALAPDPGANAAERFHAVSVLSAVVKRHLADYGMTVLSHPAGDIVAPGSFDATGGGVQVTIRATSVTLATVRPTAISMRTVLTGRIMALEADGGVFVLASLALPGGDVLRATITRLAVDDLGLKPGDTVHALIKSVTISDRNRTGKTN
jgi:molybdate transport system ATP-binding protein